MFFSDIHQRVAADISFDAFIGQLCYALECNLNDPDAIPGEDLLVDLTWEEYRWVESNSNILYLLFDGF